MSQKRNTTKPGTSGNNLDRGQPKHKRDDSPADSGPSGNGKTALCERIVTEGYQAAAVGSPLDESQGEIAYPTPGSSIPVDFCAPALTRLIERTLLPHQVIPSIEAIFTSQDEVKAIGYLRGDDAQAFIDIVHEALDLPDLPPRLWKKCLNTLGRICGRHALLPRSLQIPLCYDRSDIPLYSGGFADVRTGEHQGRRVAVKVLRVHSMSNFDKITSGFCKEVVTWKTLRHPNVLPLLGATMSNNQFAMVSEWMVHGNINEYIKAHRDVNRFELLEDTIRGLAYIHSRAMVHGDLKGANVLVNQQGNACLADFGLLTIISDPTNPTASSSSMKGGTTRWMSPELLDPERFGSKDGRPTQESDCYALGMVIYEVLSGQAPFTPHTTIAVMRMVTEGQHPMRPEGGNGVWFTDDLWGMLEQCWVSQPKSRPGINAVLEFLGPISKAWKPPSQFNEDFEMGEDDWCPTPLSEFSVLTPTVASVYLPAGSDLIPYPHDQSSGHQPLSSAIPDFTKRNRYWWLVIGRALSELLARSSHSEDTRAHYDAFFRDFVAPLLGPAPGEDPFSLSTSLMCDDHTPVEIGWVFKPTSETSVRYAIETLSAVDGSPISTPQNLNILQNFAIASQCQGFDMTWSRKCAQSLLYPTHLIPSQDSQRVSQFFIGIDLARASMGFKAYFLPQVRSQVTKVPAMALLTSTINELGMGVAWSKATEYFSTLPTKFNVQPMIAAVDCVADAENQFKVYVRTQATHLSALCDMLTLGGQLESPAIDATLAKLRDIWRALFGPISDETPVKHKRSNTGPTGVLFCYEMALGSSSPIPEIYIPTARFLESDAHVAQVISQFVGSSYCDDVRSLFPHRTLESRSGILSHITLAAKKGACQISSYLNPEAFSQHF